jgi:hypothetical protein
MSAAVPSWVVSAYVSHDVISKIENGDRPPAEGMSERLDAIPELDTRGGLTRLWNSLRPGMRLRAYPGWFQRWVTDVEDKATLLRWFEPQVLPGLLQTEGYARALLADRIGATAEEVEESVSARMQRQGILARAKPPELWVVIDEAVLHRGVGGPCVEVGAWRKASRTTNNGGACVEVSRQRQGVVVVRDSKDPEGGTMVVSPRAWESLTRRIKDPQAGLG